MMKISIKRRRRRKNKLKVWLDDLRPMPKGFDIHVTTATEAIRLIDNGEVKMISLDHDLGAVPEKPHKWSDMYSRWLPIGDGYDVAKFIEEGAFKGTIRKMKWEIHSANPVGITNMKTALENADRYWLDKGDVGEIDGHN